ncbi:MAG: tRNA uracil 4-sulfurtransferase ThiI [Erysipelotrichaceae bacterium]
MDIKQSNITYDHILVRFGELSTKGKNKKDFIKKLLQNMKNALKGYDKLTYERTHDRIYVLLNGEEPTDICSKLQLVFGISSFSLAIKINSDYDEMMRVALMVAKDSDAKTFKMDTRRNYKMFYMMSDDINRGIADEILKQTDMKVDVKKPELRIQIEVRQFDTYIMTKRYPGAGGYPVGVGGKALVMLSGGIDSPVASYLMMKRGVTIECIHYASPPYTSSRAQQKVLDLAKAIAGHQGHIRVHIIPFTELQLEIYKHADESYAITIMRRMMYRIAEAVAKEANALALVNGESIGQVASQTLESMNTINEVTNMPVLRPVVCLDKLEIIDIAKKINTYELSIQPFEDCCTIFTPKNPVTKPSLNKAIKFEERWDYQAMIDECVSKREVINIYPTMDENSDIF